MQKKEQKPVTIVSECEVFNGSRVVFRGVRSERAWSWVWEADLPAKPPAAAPAIGRIHALIAQSNLSLHDKKQCRKSVAAMSAHELRQLEASLRAYRGRGG